MKTRCVCVLKSLSFALKKEGYDVYTAQSGTEALRCVKEIMPDLIIMDNKMPDISGWEVARRILDDEETKHIPIVGLTAYNGRKEMEQGKEVGLVEIKVKPILLEDVFDVIQKYAPNK